MTAERKAIRKSLQAMLLGNTLVGNAVYASRTYATFAEELPLIVIYTSSEEALIFNVSPREYRRTVKLVVEIVGKADQYLDDFLDDVAQQVERLVATDETLRGTAADARVAGTEMIIDASGETNIGACRVTFDVEYYKLAPQDGTEDLEFFTEANIKVDVAPADGTIDYENEINIP